MALPKCPNCGSKEASVNARPGGSWLFYFDDKGEVTESDQDGLYAVLSAVVWCPDCGKKRSDLRCDGQAVLAVTHERKANERL